MIVVATLLAPRRAEGRELSGLRRAVGFVYASVAWLIATALAAFPSWGSSLGDQPVPVAFWVIGAALLGIGIVGVTVIATKLPRDPRGVVPLLARPSPLVLGSTVVVAPLIVCLGASSSRLRFFPLLMWPAGIILAATGLFTG